MIGSLCGFHSPAQEQKSRIVDCKKIVLGRFKEAIATQYHENGNYRFAVNDALATKKKEEEDDRIRRAVAAATANAAPSRGGIMGLFV